MATEVQNGRAYIHGIRNDGTAIAITGYASFTIESASLTHQFTLDELEDELGFHKSLIASNPHVKTELVFLPDGATRAAAEAIGVFVNPLAAVVITHCAVAALNGTWIYEGGARLELSHKQGKMTLPIRKYSDATQNTSLATTI